MLKLKEEVNCKRYYIYNNRRPHLSNQMLTPLQMHQQNKLKRKQYKSKKLSNEVITQL
jgi:hypothetical protein